MNWSDFLQVLRCRAIEDADTSGRIWSSDQRRQATAEASAKERNSQRAMLAARSNALLKTLDPSFAQSMVARPAMPGWVSPVIGVAAFIIGWSLVGIGQDREINLLALPLVGLLAWNLVVLIASLFTGVKGHGAMKPPAWMEALMKKLSPAPPSDDTSPLITAVPEFREMSTPPSLARAACLSKALLHTGAAMLALGSIFAMYAHGWSNEYRAVWESTLLGEQGVTAFFRWMFAPASAVSGLTVPLSELPAMHRTLTSAAPHPGAALPWIHLYAITLALGIIIPRLIFVFWERWRGNRVADAVLADESWTRYAEKLQADASPRGNEPAILLMHAVGSDEAAAARWQNGLLSVWREVGQVKTERIPAGEEEEFLQRWMPGSPRVAFAVGLATVPEEMHRMFMIHICAKAKEKQPGARLLLLVDATALETRWRGMAGLEERLSEKTALWKRAAEGTGLDVRVLRMSGTSAA